jgi:hypothetical protein
MSAPIIKHPVDPTPDDDPTHPIPYLGVIDVVAYKKTGGADLTIVVASPLQDDERSKTRLLDKIEGYIGHIRSEQFLEDAGSPPSPDNTAITVALHPNTAPEVYALLERCQQWVALANARLIVRRLSQHELSGT